MGSSPALSVIIATYNRRDVLSKTLPTIFSQEYLSSEYEVIVVVDGSTDDTVGLLRSFSPPCFFRIIEQSNRGQGAARNAGLREARGELVLFLDDDILCNYNLLRRHVNSHKGSETLLVFGPILVASESPTTLVSELLQTFTDEYYGRLTRDLAPRYPDDAFVPPNSSASRIKLLTCGGFDESFGRARGDADFGMRLWKMGVHFKYEPAAVAHQLYTKSTTQIIRQDAGRYGRSEVLLSRKHLEYRPHSPLARLGEGSFHQRVIRKVASRQPILLNLFLSWLLWLFEQLGWVPRSKHAAVGLFRRLWMAAVLRGALDEAGNWQTIHKEFGMRLPVLLYHHIGPTRPGTYPSLSLSSEKFETEIRWLSRHGYVGIRPSDWLAWLRNGTSLPEKPVLLTFDDAYADLAHYALPILHRYGFSAGIFVVTGQVGSTNMWDEAKGSGTHQLMTAEQIREWAAQGIEFGSHGRTHADLSILSGEELVAEVAGSKKDLAEILQTSVTSFAYPYGHYNDTVLNCVSAEFDLAFTVEEGGNSLCTNPHTLRRNMVQPADWIVDFACKVWLGWSPILSLRAFIARTRKLLVRENND